MSVLASALRSYGKRLVRRAHFGVFLASFTKEAHNQRITNKKSHFPKEFLANPHIFRRSLKKVSFIEESFSGKVSLIKEISYDFSSFIKENVVSLHPD